MAFLLFCFVFAHGLLEAVCRSRGHLQALLEALPHVVLLQPDTFHLQGQWEKARTSKASKNFLYAAGWKCGGYFLKESRGPRTTPYTYAKTLLRGQHALQGRWSLHALPFPAPGPRHTLAWPVGNPL